MVYTDSHAKSERHRDPAAVRYRQKRIRQINKMESQNLKRLLPV
jgi:hypothetical protein